MLGVGIDLVEISRMEKSVLVEKFVEQNFHQSEIEIYNRNKRAAFMAGRFAAKEALAKALGTGFTDGMSLADIEITRTPSGAPAIRLHNSILEMAQKLGIRDWLVSISHTKEYATAIVIAK
jgi:holo-[acyl-carrier protein] synthase